ncbi:L-lactate permease [Phycisphaerales bacterium]|nr:L-lactate permease [Phycisphaerales bacterium]
MLLALSILPIVLLIVLMVTPPLPRLGRLGSWSPLPAHIALPAVALLAYGLQLFMFRPGPESRAAVIHAAAIDGALSSLTPLAIVLGAVLLFKTMDTSGAMRVLTERLRRMSPDPVAQLVLVGWAFSFLIEGLSGFGTPAALAAPILVGLGFPMLRVAAMCLVMNSVPVSFGAVGTPTWFGFGGLGLSLQELGEIGWRTAFIHTAAAPAIVVLALRIVVPWKEVRARLVFVLLAVAASVGPYLLMARFSVEFPSIVGGLAGLAGVTALARWQVGLPRGVTELPPGGDATGVSAAPPPAPYMSLLRAAMPLLATVLVLAVTRIDALGVKAVLNSDANGGAGAASVGLGALGEAWISPALVVGLRDILGTGTAWKMPLLYVPFILPFVAVSLAAIPLLRMNRAVVRSAWMQTAGRLARPAVALVGALVLVKMMMLGGETAPAMVMGRAMANTTGGAWPYFASLLGALGSFFSGSNTVSNLTFGPIQAAVAGTLGLDRATILALQSAGGAMGNMVCIHNIVAVAAVLGLSEQHKSNGHHNDVEASREIGGIAAVLRLTIAPMLVYALIAAAVAGVFALAF